MNFRSFGAIALAFVLETAMLTAFSNARADLVSLYNFDEASGTIVHDSVGTNNGNLFGGAVFAPGQGLYGSGALSLNQSTDDYASFGQIFPLTSGSWSMSIWEKTNATTAQIILSKHHSSILAGYFIATGNVGDGSFANSHFYESNQSDFLGSSAIVNDGAYHQLAFVHVAGGTSQYYVDGSLQSQGASFDIGPNDAPFMVGGISVTGTPTGAFTGLIDDLQVYNSALSAADMATIYQNGLSAVPEPSSFLLGFVAVGLVAGVRLARRWAKP